jgi:hypothetical protein
VLALMVVTAVGAAVFGFLGKTGLDARKFGQAVGRLAGFTAAVAFGVSWLRQTGRRRTGLGVALGYAILIVAGIVAGAVSGRSRSEQAKAPLTDAERAPLVEVDQGGERRLRHPAFGFSILHPGPSLRESPEMAKTLEGKTPDPDTQNYAYLDPGGSVVALSVMKGMGGTRASLSDHVDGFQSGFTGSAAGGPDLRWLGKELSWNASRHDARLKGLLGGDTRLELASYAIIRPQQPPLIVNVLVVSREIDRFTKLLSSFREN